MAKSKVAVLKVKPETILEDIERLCELGGMKEALAPGAHDHPQGQHLLALPVPGARTRRPGRWRAPSSRSRTAGLTDISCVQNKTVVTNAFKGEDLNHYVPLFKKYEIPVLYNFKPEDMKWVDYRPKAKMHVLARHLPGGDPDPRLLLRQEHRPSADGEVSHLHDDHGRDEERVRRPLGDASGTTRTRWIHRTLVDLLAIQKEIHSGLFAIMDGTTAGNGPGPRTMFPVVKDYMLASRRSGGDRRRRRQDDGLRSDVARVHQASPTTTASASAIRATSRSSGDDISNESWGFQVGDNGASHVGRLACGSGR